MHKILLQKPLIGSYSFCLFFAILTGYLLTRYNGRRTGIKGSHIDNLALLGAGLGLFGARFFSWGFYYPPGRSFWKALFDSSGGMVFYGGMIFGIITVVTYSLLARLPLGKLMDTFAPGMALGLAFGRACASVPAQPALANPDHSRHLDPQLPAGREIPPGSRRLRAACKTRVNRCSRNSVAPRPSRSIV
jgi:hypothetical protein